jgi:hypothetical protein
VRQPGEGDLFLQWLLEFVAALKEYPKREIMFSPGPLNCTYLYQISHYSQSGIEALLQSQHHFLMCSE